MSGECVDNLSGLRQSPPFILGSKADSWCIEHLRNYFQVCMAEHPTFVGHSKSIIEVRDFFYVEKLLNVDLLIDKTEALNLIPSTPFVLKYPSFSPISVVDSDFLIEDVDTFLVSEDSIPPGIESDLGSDEDIIFLDNLLNDDIFIIDPGGGEIDVSQNIEDDDSFTFVIQTFLLYHTYPVDSPLLLSIGSEDTIFDPEISINAGGTHPGGHMADFHHLDDARDILISVKARSWSYDSRGTSAPTHSAFISVASTNSKMSYPEQSHSTTFTSASSSPAASSNVIENVLHSFVAESDPQQQITYEDFDQIGKLDLEE
ncbi:hypothetical protein Tco_1531652 [Tanacetum coccineum]